MTIADAKTFSSPRGRVALVGAGPGSPDLITLRGLALLRSADVVVFDRLAGSDLLREARADAIRIDAGKSPGRSTLSQQEINTTLVTHAQRGRLVVRLKGGDPFIFGRGYEELEACRQAGVPCEIVPGVTSAIAAPAAAGIPVTARQVARTFAIVTPQSAAGSEPEPLDYAALSRIDTVSILMARGMLRDVARNFIKAGRDPNTPAAIIENATLDSQRSLSATLDTIADEADRAEVSSPAVVVIGEVARLHAPAEAALSALSGRTVVVTRPRSASESLIASLRKLGAIVIDCPLIRIEYPPPAREDWLTNEYDWAVFTSLHAVRGFWRTLRWHGFDARRLRAARVAAVGPKTACELEAIGIVPDFVPDVHRASALVERLPALSPHTSGARPRVLFPCGTLARDELRAGLRAAGMLVDELVVYDTLPESPTPDARQRIDAGADAYLFYCPSAVASAVRAELPLDRSVLACIGPTTAAALRAHTLSAAVVPEEHTDQGLLSALLRHFADHPSEVRS